MPSRSKAVNSAAMLRCEFSVPDHAPAQCWNRQIGGALVRRSLSISQIIVAAIGLFGTLASPAFAQTPPTVLRATITRSAGELVTAADGGSLDLVTYGGSASYLVRISNIGISRAYSVSLTGAAPPGPTPTRITAVTGAGCTIATGGSTFTCANLGDLPDGVIDGGFLPATSTTSTITISVAAVPRPYTTNCTLPDGGPVDGNTLGPVTVTALATNAPAVQATTAGVTTTRPLADLAVSATGPDTASESSVVSYQVHAQNNGPCTASRPRLTNGNVSAGLIFQGSTGTACTGGYPCTIANSWPAGASVDVTSSYQVDFLPVAIKQSQELQQFDLASTALGAVFATPDPVPANNTAALSTSVSHDTGCSSVGAGSLGFVGIALAAMGLIRRRRRA